MSSKSRVYLKTSNFLIILLIVYGLVISQVQAQRYLLNDGPYIHFKTEGLFVDWVCQGKVQSRAFAFSFPFVFDECEMKAVIESLQYESSTIEFNGDFKIAAISDIHGQYTLMKDLLVQNGIVNRKGDWSFGDGHLVITGDVFDRGGNVTEVLWFIYRLEQLAKREGGRVHLLLGNHEVMVLNGDLRYLHDKYVYIANLFKRSFESLYDKDSVLGAWLRSKPVLVKINNILYMHGGIELGVVKKELSLKKINSIFSESLVKSEMKDKRDSIEEYLHGSKGPIWYRGYFDETAIKEAELDLILEHFRVDKIVVGHTSQAKVESRYNGKVIAIDTGIKNGKNGEILIINESKFYRGKLSGEQSLL